jgi:hypothetical protein
LLLAYLFTPTSVASKSQVSSVDQEPDCQGALSRHVVRASPDNKPCHLQSNYRQGEILMDRDGSVKGGTVSALVDRLIFHEHEGKQWGNLVLWLD